MKSSLLIAFLLLGLLCGLAAAKASKPKEKMAQQQTKGRISGDDVEVQLEQCLGQLRQLTSGEAAFEQTRDECLDELAPLIVEDELHEQWRDSNHTRAITCLLNVTECNDANEARVVSGADKRVTRAVYDESIVNHPYKNRERRARSKIAAMDVGRYEALLKSRSESAKREKREAYKCTLNQCEEMVSVARHNIETLQENITWCRNEVQRRKKSIMAFLRFSTLWQQEWNLCEPIAEKCRSGLRLIKVTLQNGDFNSITYQFSFEPGWVGFTQSDDNLFYQDGQNSQALTDLRNGQPETITDSFAPVNAPNDSTTVGEEVLENGESWSVTFELDPVTNHLFYAFPVTEPLTLGDQGEFIVSRNGVQIFLGSNFVHRVMLDVISPPTKKQSRKKRGPHAQELAECGCVGDDLPFYQPHVFHEVVQTTAEFDGENTVYQDNTYPAGFAAIIVEELRWSVPYPAGIRPEVRPAPTTPRNSTDARR